MSVEYLPNVCRISDNCVRHFLCQTNIRRMSVKYSPNVCRISAECLSNIRRMAVEYLRNVCRICDNYVRHFLCQTNICRTYPVEGGTGACVLPFEGIPVAGASPIASRFEQAVCVTDRRIRSWCGGCATSGKRREAICSGLCQ